jgi:hypothetical protein
VGQEGCAEVKTGAGVEPRGVVENVQQGLLVGAAGPPGVRAGVVWPQRAPSSRAGQRLTGLGAAVQRVSGAS